jgi:hypothetical protein
MNSDDDVSMHDADHHAQIHLSSSSSNNLSSSRINPLSISDNDPSHLLHNLGPAYKYDRNEIPSNSLPNLTHLRGITKDRKCFVCLFDPKTNQITRRLMELSAEARQVHRIRAILNNTSHLYKYIIVCRECESEKKTQTKLLF